MLGEVIKILPSVSKASSWQNASHACRPVGEVPTCISAVCVSDKWTAERFQPTRLKRIRLYYQSILCCLLRLQLSLTLALRFLALVECDSFPLLSSSSIATYMMGGCSRGKTLVRNLYRSSESCVRSSSRYPWGLFVASKYALNRPLLSSGST